MNIVEVIKPTVKTVEVSHGGVQGPPGSGGGGGGSMVGMPTFIQQAQPTYADGPYIWYQTDALGQIVEIYLGP